MSKEINNINLDDDLEIMDLDDEDIVYEDIDGDTEGFEEEAFEEEAFEEEAFEEETLEEVCEDEVCEGEVYESEEYAEGEYADDVEEMAEEDLDSQDFAEEYDDSDEAFGSVFASKGQKNKKKKENDDKEDKPGFLDRFIHMDTMDKVIMSLGCLVLALAIVVVSEFASYKMSDGQVMAFSDMGNEIDKISLIGESGLLAVTDATVAKIDALNENADEDDEEDDEEEDVNASVVVQMNFTSIQKDLKIKFTNKKSGKLIAGIPFEVELVTPSGKTLNWSDDDKDGIIYHKDIEAGEYQVTLKALEGEIYEKYILDTTTQKATVKKEIAYTKIDVSDEILDESEIDASKEDTKLSNPVESALTDTVAWVATEKVSAGKGYVEIEKSNIVAPSTTARLTSYASSGIMMVNLSSQTLDTTVTMNQPSATVEQGKTVTLSATATDGAALTWSSDKTEVATVDANGVVTGVSEGSATITATGTNGPFATWTVTVTAASVTISISPASQEVEVGKTVTFTATCQETVTWSSNKPEVATVDTNGVVTGKAAGDATITATSTSGATASASITVKAASVTTSITLDKTETSIATGESVTIKATTTPSENVTVTWKSSDPTIATVENGKITGVAAGSATITATLTNGTETKEATCKVTVTKAARKVTLDASKLSMAVGGTKTLKATVEGYTDLSGGKVTWKSSDTSLATVDEKGLITALKTGTVTITATNTENGEKVEATCTVTITSAVTLKTKNNEDVYVLKNNTYVKATAADYAKADTKFYIYTETYKYLGWWTIDGKTYYYGPDYKKVTGEQVIMGAKYVFDSNGVLTSSNGTMGIDVSKWNGTIDWNAVKASGISYVIIRCGYRGSSLGSLIEDPKFKTNIKGATSAGLKVGVYFFSQAIDEIEAVQEASMVLSLIEGYKISYPIFIDVEAANNGRANNISKDMRTKVCKAFCQTIQNAGYTAGVYANKDWLTNKIDTSQLGSYKIWLAQYATKPTYTGRYEIWQYKDTGSVPGISGHVDLNLSYLGY